SQVVVFGLDAPITDECLLNTGTHRPTEFRSIALGRRKKKRSVRLRIELAGLKCGTGLSVEQRTPLGAHRYAKSPSQRSHVVGADVAIRALVIRGESEAGVGAIETSRTEVKFETEYGRSDLPIDAGLGPCQRTS